MAEPPCGSGWQALDALRRGAPVRGIVMAIAALVVSVAACRPAAANDELFALLQSGDHFGVMRHGIAPGSDDPPNFQIGDCSTQRNLSEEGRLQGVQMGERLRAAGITDARIMSSQWCRCVDTASALGLGEVQELPSLNSFITFFREREQMTRDLTSWLLEQDLSRPTILVGHAVNFSALVGVMLDEAEIAIVQRTPDQQFRVIGRVRPD